MPSNALVPSNWSGATQATVDFIEFRRTLCSLFELPLPIRDFTRFVAAPNMAGLLDDCIGALLASHLNSASVDSDDFGLTQTAIQAETGHRLSLIRNSLEAVQAVGLRPLPVVRGRRFALPQTASSSRDMTPLAECIDRIMKADYAQHASFVPLRPKLRLLQDIIRGDAELADIESIAPAIVRAYARGYESERARTPIPLETWRSQDWEHACADVSARASCILPRGHKMGHHRREAGSHAVDIADKKLDVIGFLIKLRVETMDDAAAWTRFYRDRHFHAALRLSRIDSGQAIAVRELIDLAVHERWITDGPISPGMRKLKHRVEHLSSRGAS